VGNLLAGSDENAAVVETTLMGLRIKVLRDTVVAVTGGDLQARKGSAPCASADVEIAAGPRG
jgi:allophanate hydrolase subunit 2